jgi:superoxide dismutase, Cu-Zn family
MRTSRLAITLLFAVGLAACGNDADAPDAPRSTTSVTASRPATGSPQPTAAAEIDAALIDRSGEEIGQVTVGSVDGGTVITVTTNEDSGLAEGFHGMHVHAVGRCNTPDFTAAGPHLRGADGGDHGDHAGDLPALLVGENGRGLTQARTTRLTIADLTDADGSALIVHAGPDNYANIPSRYGTPDADTKSAGDSGPRLACAELRIGGGTATSTATSTSGGAATTTGGATSPTPTKTPTPTSS